jgi:Skp family chaperone for outer membrane proteins
LILKLIFSTLIYFFLFIPYVYANQNIATLNLDKIFQNSDIYNNFILDLNIIREDYDKSFKRDEKLLLEKRKKIDDSRLILNQDEIDNLIKLYNNEYNSFNDTIKMFNNKVSNLLDYNQKILLNEIVNISKRISTKNNFHIILSEENYFIASDNYDITNLVISELNKMNIELKKVLE